MGAVTECRSASPAVPSSLVGPCACWPAAVMSGTSVLRDRPAAEGLRMWKRGMDGSAGSAVFRGGRCAFKWAAAALPDAGAAREELLIAKADMALARGGMRSGVEGAAGAEGGMEDDGRPPSVILAVVMVAAAAPKVFRSPRGRFCGVDLDCSGKALPKSPPSDSRRSLLGAPRLFNGQARHGTERDADPTLHSRTLLLPVCTSSLHALRAHSPVQPYQPRPLHIAETSSSVRL